MAKEKRVKGDKAGQTTGLDVQNALKKKKKKLDTSKQAAQSPKKKEVAGQVGLASDKTSKRHKQKRRREDDQNLAPEEAERRKRQRVLQERALKLRAEGKTYDRWKAKRQLINQKKRVEGTGARKAGYDSKRGAHQEVEDGSRPTGPVQVIIVPIFWNKNKEEKASVISSAERVERLLTGAGITAGVDTTNPMTPGQKFKYWEEKGVKVRVELGPREAAAGTAVLAKCSVPGEVAQKTPLQGDEALLQAVQQHFGLPSGGAGGPSASSQHKTAPQPGPGQDAVQKKKKKKEKGGSDVPSKRLKAGSQKEERPGGNVVEEAGGEEVLEQPEPLKVPLKKDMRASGDDLEDDFGDALDSQLEEEEEEQRPGKKKKKKKAKGKEANGANLVSINLKDGLEKKKKPKVVVF